MINREMIEILRCPRCKGELDHREEPEAFACTACKLIYAVEEGIPNFLIDEAKPLER